MHDATQRVIYLWPVSGWIKNLNHIPLTSGPLFKYSPFLLFECKPNMNNRYISFKQDRIYLSEPKLQERQNNHFLE